MTDTEEREFGGGGVAVVVVVVVAVVVVAAVRSNAGVTESERGLDSWSPSAGAAVVVPDMHIDMFHG